MQVGVDIAIDVEKVVPTEQAARVAWLERFGRPEVAEFCVRAELSEWYELGVEISPRGEVLIPSRIERKFTPGTPGAIVGGILEEACTKYARETGLGAVHTLPRELMQIAFEGAKHHIARAREAAAARERLERETLAKVDKAIASVDERALLLRLLVQDDRKGRLSLEAWVAEECCKLVEVDKSYSARVPDELCKRMIARFDEEREAIELRETAAWKDLELEVLQKHAPEKLPRYNAGFLPESEIAEVIAAQLFDGLGAEYDSSEIKRAHWPSILAHTIATNHSERIGRRSVQPTLRRYTQSEFDALEALRPKLHARLFDASSRHELAARATEISTEYVEHFVDCAECCEELGFVRTIKITVQFYDQHYFMREFVL